MPKFENLNELVGVPSAFRETQDQTTSWNNLNLEEKLTTIDSMILAVDYAKDENKKTELYQFKGNLLKYYLGEEMTGEEFAAFEKALVEDPSKKEKINSIIRDKNFTEIQKNKESLINVLFGRQLEELRKYNNVVDVPHLYNTTPKLREAWRAADLDGKLINIDTVILTDYNNYSIDHLQENYDIKKTLVKHRLGQDMSDDEFNAFDNALTDDPDKSKLFDVIVKDMSVDDIIQDADTLTIKLFGKELAKMRLQKNENAKIPTAEEQKQAEEKTEKILQNSFLKSRRNSAMKTYLNHMKEEQSDIIRKARVTLGYAVPNRAANGPEMKNIFADHEAEKKAWFEASAQLVGVTGYKIKDPKDASLFDMVALQEAEIERQKAIKDLETDQNFQAFVLSVIAKKNAELFEPETMFSSWNSYCMTLEEANATYKQQLSNFRENGTVPDALAFFGPNVTGIAKNELAPENKNGGNLSTKENLKAMAKTMLSSAENEGRERALDQKDFVKAANLIVANALLSKAADLTLFETEGYKNEKGEYFIDKMNKSIVELRDQVIADPLFQKVLARRVNESEIVSSYQREVNREVNKKINKQEKLDSELKKDQEKSRIHKKYASEHTIELTDKEMDFIRETYRNIKKFNEGKDPSPLMEKLTNALDDVTGVQGNKVSIEKMEKLNKATLEYYKERQGKIFSPVTKRGKARLGAVERMAFLTDDVMGRAMKQEKTDLKKQVVKVK